MKQNKTPKQKFHTIPKLIHFIWVGDESKCPHHWMQTWRDHHPTWEFRLWGNKELNEISWRSKRQIEIFRTAGQWPGVADLMRYEILLEHGGVYVDADSICVKALDDWLLDTKMFAAWENEELRPGLIANGYIGAVPNHPALKAIVEKTSLMNRPYINRVLHKPYWNRGLRFRYKVTEVWESVGPTFFTKMVMPFCPMDVTILPSVLFMPQHHSEKEQRKSSLIYAQQIWGTAHKLYDK